MFARQVSKNIYSYELIGTNTNLVYNSNNGEFIVADVISGAPLEMFKGDYGLSFSEFVDVAKQVYKDIIDSIKTGNAYA